MFNTGKLLKFIFIILFFIFCTEPGKGQASFRQRSVLSAGGSSGFITANGRQYFIQQTTGQQSITGISRKQDYMLRQGFIQPYNLQYNKTIRESLPVDICPNPFSSRMSLSFPEASDNSFYVTIYDLNGKIVFFRKYEPLIVLDLDLSSLSSSVYLIRVNTARSSFYTRIIKL